MLMQNADISVMSALAVEVAFSRWIVPAFERQTGRKLAISWDPTTVLMRRIAEGERADVIVAIDDSMDKLEKQLIIRAETRVPIAQAMLGLAVKTGAPHPDISTLAAFTRTLKAANSIALSQGGASGIYFLRLIERLGIGDIVGPKAVTIAAGFTAEKLVSGEAELAVQQISELMTVDGAEVVGPFPDEVQTTTNFSVAVFADAKNPEGALAFIKALVSKEADVAYRNGGLISRLNID